MAFRPYIKDSSGKLNDLPLAAETAVQAQKADTATNYASSGNIKTKFDSVDTALGNVGKLKVGSTWYQARSTSSTTDKGQAGFITFII